MHVAICTYVLVTYVHAYVLFLVCSYSYVYTFGDLDTQDKDNYMHNYDDVAK